MSATGRSNVVTITEKDLETVGRDELIRRLVEAEAALAEAHALIGGRDSHGPKGDARCLISTVGDILEASRANSAAEALMKEHRDAARFLAAGWRRLAAAEADRADAEVMNVNRALIKASGIELERDNAHARAERAESAADWHRRRADAFHRRAQQAERVAGFVEAIRDRPQTGGPGRSLGRALANYAAQLEADRADRAESRLAWWGLSYVLREIGSYAMRDKLTRWLEDVEKMAEADDEWR